MSKSTLLFLSEDEFYSLFKATGCSFPVRHLPDSYRQKLREHQQEDSQKTKASCQTTKE